MICLASALALSTFVGMVPADQVVGSGLKDGKVVIRSVTLLMVGATVKLWGTGLNGETLPDEAKQLRASMRESATKVLAAKGCVVPDDPFTQAAQDNNPEMKAALTKVLDQYHPIEAKMFRKPKSLQDNNYTLGDDVTKLARGHATDAFLFMDAFGSLTTQAEKTKRIFTGPANTAKEALYLNLTLVDARTGAVVYFSKNTTGGNFITDPAHVDHNFQDSLRDFDCAEHKTQ